MQKREKKNSGNKFDHKQGEIEQGDMAFLTPRSVNKHTLLVLGVHHRARNDVEICCPCYLHVCRSLCQCYTTCHESHFLCQLEGLSAAGVFV